MSDVRGGNETDRAGEQRRLPAAAAAASQKSVSDAKMIPRPGVAVPRLLL